MRAEALPVFPLALLLATALLGCCDGVRGLPEETGVRTDLEGLEEWARLPISPESVTWRIQRTSGGGRISTVSAELEAVLRYPPGDLERMQALVDALPPGTYWALMFNEWWPPEALEAFHNGPDLPFHDATGLWEGEFEADPELARIVRLGTSPTFVLKLYSPG